MSASSSMILLNRLSDAVPALVSMRMRNGPPAPAAWSRAANFFAMPGSTRSSVSAVITSVGG